MIAPSVTLSEEKIIEFAQEYDPQAIHIDKPYAEAGPFKGIIASGFQTVAACFASFLRLGYYEDVSLAGPGMDEIRWVKPVRPNDTLTPHITVAEARPSRSKQDRGVLQLVWDVRNQDGDTVLTMMSATMIRSRRALD